jgi:hypothetical protein
MLYAQKKVIFTKQVIYIINTMLLYNSIKGEITDSY